MSQTAAAPPPLRGAALGITAFALALGTFMQVLDTTIANVSLPTIAGNLGVSSDNGTWIITSFAVANGVAVPLTGWLMGRYGVVRTFVASVALFTLASLLCGIAWNLSSLIVFRIIQGAVSGPMIPGSQALLIAIFPSDKRATALGIWSMTTLIAPVMGPVLGGYISDNYHWSWIFLINVPVGLVATIVSWRFLASRESPTRRLPIDRVGLIMLALWVGALQIMLDLGKNEDWFNSPTIVVAAIIAAVVFVAWVIWETTDDHPTVDLSLFKLRNFTFGAIPFCLGYAVFFANTLLLPLWLQTQLGYTATWAGLVLAPTGVIAMLLTPLVARLSGQIDPRWLATVSFIAFGASFFMRAGYTSHADFWSLALPLFVQGIGVSSFFVSMLTISLDGIAPERVPSATGMINFGRITAASFAASIVTTMWDRREALHQSRLAEGLNSNSPVYRQAVETLNHQGLTDQQAAAAITHQVVAQSYLLSSTEIFWICGWLSMAMVALVWLVRRPAKMEAIVAAD